jgi:short-subunit dehydrogenase
MGLRRLFKNHLYRKEFNISETEITTNKIKNQNIIITGANSGIGLALTEKFIELDNKVFATYNKTNDNLLKLKSNNLKICQCDQSQLDNIDKLKDHVKNIPINIIINNAGVWGGKNQNFNKIDYENFLKTLNINAISILKLSELVLQHSMKNTLRSILNISSLYGSTEHNTTGKDYVYKGTKSMMNSFSKNLSIDLKRDYGVNVFSICPGSVKTKLNPGGILKPKIAALNIINILVDADKHNGKFIDLNKNELPW